MRKLWVLWAACSIVAPTLIYADPIEVGTDDVSIQLSANLKAHWGRSDAPVFGYRAQGGGDGHLSSADNFHYYQLGVDAHAQYRDVTADVDFLATGAPTDWVDPFSHRDLWVREASIGWTLPEDYGKVTAGRLKFGHGFGVEANSDLLPMTGVRYDNEFGDLRFTYLTADVNAGTNNDPQFVELFGGYPNGRRRDVFTFYRASTEIESPSGTTQLGVTFNRPSILLARRYAVDMTTKLRNGREVSAVYQTTPRNIFGQHMPDDGLLAVSGDLVKNNRWHIRGAWAEAGNNYAASLVSHTFPYGASWDEIVFERPLFLGAPIPTDSATNPTASTPNYGIIMDGIELDVRYALTESSSLRARYIRGDQQNGVDLGDILYLVYRKGLGHGMTAQVSYGHVTSEDPFNVGARGYDMFQVGVSVDDFAGLVSEYLKEVQKETAE